MNKEKQSYEEPDMDWLDKLMASAGPPPPDPDDPGPQEEPVGPSRHYQCTDLANSERFWGRNGSDLKYCYERQAWLVWTGTHWSWERAQQEIERRTFAQAKQELLEAIEGGEKPVVTWSKRSTTWSARQAAADGCRNQASVSVEALDTDPLLFNTSGGTIDLRDGLSLAPRRQDLLTHLSPVAFQPGLRAPRWTQFLREVTGDSTALAEYLQRAVGYSLTARMDEQQFFVCVGAGSNGKSVFLGALRSVLGTYARTISAALLTTEKSHNKFPELADLLGVRFAVATEPSAKAQLDEPLLKALTGGDELVGERKFEAPFSFRPVCKVWLACNQIPSFQSGGFSMDRRIVVIPFRQTFSGDRIDPRLPEKLSKEAAGILAWAVEGAKRWLAEGLEQPPEIREAIKEARGDTDPLHHWYAECVVRAEPKTRTAVSDLYASYKAWCEAAGQKPRELAGFRGLLRGRSLELVSMSRRLHAVGVRLVKAGEAIDDEESEQFGLEEVE